MRISRAWCIINSLGPMYLPAIGGSTSDEDMERARSGSKDLSRSYPAGVFNSLSDIHYTTILLYWRRCRCRHALYCLRRAAEIYKCQTLASITLMLSLSCHCTHTPLGFRAEDKITWIICLLLGAVYSAHPKWPINYFLIWKKRKAILFFFLSI